MIRLKKGIASRCWENLVLLSQATDSVCTACL